MVIKEKKEGEKEEEKISTLLEDLASLESYARDLSSFLPLPIFLVSPVGIILEVNPAFEKITGYEIEEIIGKPIEEFFSEEEIKDITETTFKKGFIKAKEARLFIKEKKKIPVSVSTTLRKSEEGEAIGYFVGLFDLSDIQEKEKELTNAQKALLNILEDTAAARKAIEIEKNKTLAIITNFADGLLVFDEEGNLSLINPKTEELFGVKTKEVVGKTSSELSKNPNLTLLIDLLKKENKGIYRKELSLKEDLTLEVSTVPLIGGEMGILVILHDITREKMIERMKTEFVSLSAHQLRTPLSAIKWTLRMLLDGDLGEITEEQRDFIDKTYRSNERMINLINDLLDITRIEEGRYLYKPTLADIDLVAQFVINLYKEEIEKKNIKLEFKKPGKKLPRVMIDVEKIRLVIENLLDNAIRYTPPGGEVTISLKGDIKGVELSIKDTGLGIPKDQQGRIFTKFFRGTNAIRMETEGSGLGLFISKNIIEAHGGRVWFESEEGKGTTFYFTLPLKEQFVGFLKEF